MIYFILYFILMLALIVYALYLNKDYKWVIKSDVENSTELGNSLIFILILGCLIWPVTLLIISIRWIIVTLWRLVKSYLPDI